jgi:hypothetical protein
MGDWIEHTRSDINNNYSSPVEGASLPDASSTQGYTINDEMIYSTDPSSRLDLVSDGDIGLIPDSPSCSSATYSAGDEMDIDKESLEQDVNVGQKRVQSLSPHSPTPTSQKRTKSSYRQNNAPGFTFSHPFKPAPPRPSAAHSLPKPQTNIGISRSARASRKLKEDMISGKHVVDERARANFESDCQIADSEAQFRYKEEKWKVFHSSCGKW